MSGNDKAKLDGAPYDQFGGFFHPVQRPMPSGGTYWSGGLTLRDWFAGHALKGMLASGDPECETYAAAASYAYAYADAMLAERSKP